MISGRVPIVTDIGGHREIIEDGVNGFIAADPTVEALDEALERAWSAREDWQAIGARARAAAQAYLPDDPVADAAGKLLRLV
jgi:glycosyltransferase involved in cell wall biosynthesis